MNQLIEACEVTPSNGGCFLGNPPHHLVLVVDSEPPREKSVLEQVVDSFGLPSQDAGRLVCDGTHLRTDASHSDFEGQ